MDGVVCNFSAGGLYDGLVLLVDDETETYWHQITGEALYGPLVDLRLETFPLYVLPFGDAKRRFPQLHVSEGEPGVTGWIMNRLVGDEYRTPGRFPSHFLPTMGASDDRLPKLLSGLAVVVEGGAKFYPLRDLPERLVDEVAGERVEIVRSADGAFAEATRVGSADRPLQFLTRWYGFSYSYPGAAIYAAPSRPSSQ